MSKSSITTELWSVHIRHRPKNKSRAEPAGSSSGRPVPASGDRFREKSSTAFPVPDVEKLFLSRTFADIFRKMLPIVQAFPTVILADGAFPFHEIPLSSLQTAERIIACDGAAEPLLNAGLTPDYIVGDLDSLPAELKRRHARRLIHISEQETNDLTKSVRFCVENGWEEITIVGATGRREDHTLGNISLLAEYVETARVQMLTDSGVFIPLKQSSVFESFAGQQVSIFALDPQTLFRSEGLQYPLDNRRFSSWWQGTLNESTGRTFALHFRRGDRVIVFRTYPPRNTTLR
jgi:thiamine pyrophosphokinase